MSEVLVYDRGEWQEQEKYDTWDFEDYCFECRGLGDDSYFVWDELVQDYDRVDNCADCPFNPLREGEDD